MKEIIEQCYELELLNIKPGIVLLGQNKLNELVSSMNFIKAETKEVFIHEITVSDYTLKVVKIFHDDDCVDVYGKRPYDNRFIKS